MAAERFTHRLADGKTVHISMISVASSADAVVKVVHGKHLATTDTVGRLAERAGAVAAVNGSFFDVQGSAVFSGYPGDPLGIQITDGELLSEAANGRTALILPGGGGGRPRIDEVRTHVGLRASDGARREVDGVNRMPGRIVGCGGVGGDRLSVTMRTESRPRHNQLCLDSSEIVAFGPEWGVRSPPGAAGSAEALLDAHGRVSQVRQPAGGVIPPNGSTLVGIGEGANWLLAHARPGHLVVRDVKVTDRVGKSVLTPALSVLGAGPSLVRDGRQWINSEANGFAVRTASERQPRTVAGIKNDGTLLLAVFDGRSSSSAGVTFEEAARTLLRMGAVDALNLDGGGSTTVVVEGRVRNSPSDGRQRKVANALAVVPRE